MGYLSKANRIKKSLQRTAEAPIVKAKRKLLEKDIQKTIVAWLEANSVHVAVTNAERVWSKHGFPIKSKVSPDHPDLTCVLPIKINQLEIGLAMYIEVKTPTGSIREGQKVKLRALAGSGALCILARSLDDVIPVVRRFKDKELDYEAFLNTRTLLDLQLSDRRSKEVRDALAIALAAHNNYK